MKRIIYLIAIGLLLLAAPAYSAQLQNLTVYFEKDKAVLSATELQKLQALKAADMVLLQGHTDDEGSEVYNIGLSKRRVNAIKAVIAGLDPAIKTEALSYGESKPVAGNKNEAQKQLNRRVEISWISDPILRIKTPVQFYEVDATKANTVTCREGTKIEIPAGAFADKKVLIKVSEYYNAASILSANLGTRSDGKPIESAGMIYITAETNGQSVEPSQPLKFKFARNNKNKDFKIFAGERNANFEMNWKTGVKKETPAAPAAIGIIQVTFEMDKDCLSTAYYNATVSGSIGPELTSFWNNMSDVVTRKEFSLNGCLEKSIVDIDVNTDGRITAVRTNYTDKNTECDRSVQKYIRAYLPQRFTKQEMPSQVHIEFHPYSPELEVMDMRVTRQNIFATVTQPDFAGLDMGWGLELGNEFNADYETDAIVLSSTQLGWINCDRFMNNKLVDYTVQTTPDANVRVLMKNYNSFFFNEYWNADRDATIKAQKAGNYIFRKIPADEEVMIISTRRIDGKIMLAVADAKTSINGIFSKLNYKEVTQKELEEAMKNLKI